MITALAGTLLILAGCSQAELEMVPGAGGLRITVDSGEIGTRATETDDEVAGAGRENLIKTIDYFLFAGDGSGRYLYKGHVDPAVEATTYTVYDAAAIAGLANGTYKVFVIVNYPGATADLGENGSPSSDSDKRTMDELNQILLRESDHQTFLGSADDIPEPAGDDKLFLVMTGVNDSFSFDASNAVNEVTVPLYRLAAKVTMEFYVKDTVTPESSDGVTETWTPMTDGTNVRVYLCRGARTIRLDGGIPAAAELAAEETTLFDYKSGPYCSAMASSKDGYSHAFASDAFYTYPRTWDAGDADEPYLKLIIPWKVKRVAAEVASEYQKEFYYKVMLPSSLAGDDKGFESNHWYRLLVDVDRVGSITEDAAVELTCHYEVADWNSQPVTSSLVQGYFLDVNRGQPTLTVYAANTVEIPYTASGPVVLRVKYPTRTDSNRDGIIDIYDTEGAINQQVDAVYYTFNLTASALQEGDEENDTNEYDTGSHKVYLPSGEGYSISLRESDHHIVITHELKDNYSANNPTYDVSPFEFTFTLGLEDDPTKPNNLYDRTVTVIQYPPLYVQAQMSGKVTETNSPGYSTVFVNGVNTEGSSVYSQGSNGTTLNTANAPYYMGSIAQISEVTGGTGFNKSPYMIEVSATILKNYQFYLGPDKKYAAVIDDPRVAMGERLRLKDTNGNGKIDNGDDAFDFDLSTDINGYVSGDGENSFNKTYRPTSHDKPYMIAPRFRVASSWGKTGPSTYEGALRRCAAYQEEGYPAGRWRLPTPAEVAFLIKLSDDGYILSMFDPEDMGVWGSPPSGNNTSTSSVATSTNVGQTFLFVNDAYWAGGEWGRFYVATANYHPYHLVWAIDNPGDNWPSNKPTSWPTTPGPNEKYAFRSLDGHSSSVPYYSSSQPRYTYSQSNNSVGRILYDFSHNHGYRRNNNNYDMNNGPKNIQMYSRCVYDSWYWDELEQDNAVDHFEYKPVPVTQQP